MSVFSDIYRGNRWNGQESLSGPGSGDAATEAVRPQIQQLVAELDIMSVLDYGCGDGYWMPYLPGYVGYDPTPEAINRARQLHPDRQYTCYPIPISARFDLVICRDVIQHLSYDSALKALDDIWNVRPKYLLASTYRGTQNFDIPDGGAYSPNLQDQPFGFPEPMRWIFDGYYYHQHDTGQVRDSQKYLALWRIT